MNAELGLPKRRASHSPTQVLTSYTIDFATRPLSMLNVSLCLFCFGRPQPIAARVRLGMLG